MTPEEIKAARQRLGLTQAKFAERLGTRQATVSDWESGKHPISRAFVLSIQNLLPNEKL